jgi:hypothetical protein
MFLSFFFIKKKKRIEQLFQNERMTRFSLCLVFSLGVQFPETWVCKPIFDLPCFLKRDQKK